MGVKVMTDTPTKALERYSEAEAEANKPEMALDQTSIAAARNHSCVALSRSISNRV